MLMYLGSVCLWKCESWSVWDLFLWSEDANCLEQLDRSVFLVDVTLYSNTEFITKKEYQTFAASFRTNDPSRRLRLFARCF